MPDSTSVQLASPFDRIFADRAEAEWAFTFLSQTLELLKAGSNGYRPCALTLPKQHKRRLLRFNFGPWLLLDFCGPSSHYGKRIHLALLAYEFETDPSKRWFVFNYPHDRRGVGVYRFSWAEVQSMDPSLAEHYEASMHYAGELFTRWKGSPYRLAHQSQLFAAVLDPALRAHVLTHGLEPSFTNSSPGESANG